MQVPKAFDHLEINENLQRALDSIFDTKENTIIIGNAGTGKSEIVKIISYLSHNDTIFLSPTGIAAVNIGGQTIHSFFKFPPSLIRESDIELNEKTALILNSIKRIVIDEITMVRTDLFDAIDSALKFYRGCNDSFGGLQMVIVGDLYQLPPVIKKKSDEYSYIQDVWGGEYFFNSYAFRSTEWSKIELTKVYRQKDPMFTEVLNRIRKGNQTQKDLDVLNERIVPFGKFTDDQKEVDFVYLTAFNKIAEKENDKRLNMLPGKLETIHAFYDQTVNPKNFMPPEILRIKEGAKVMLLNNTEDWKNGDIGFIISINRTYIKVQLPNRTVTVEPVKFDEYEYDYDKTAKSITKKIKGSFIQYPMKLAYAITIHKSQGQTFEGGYINTSGKFNFIDHIFYVAISRFRDLDKIGISHKIENHHISINEKVNEFMSQFYID